MSIFDLATQELDRPDLNWILLRSQCERVHVDMCAAGNNGDSGGPHNRGGFIVLHLWWMQTGCFFLFLSYHVGLFSQFRKAFFPSLQFRGQMSINGSHQSSSRGSADRECTSFSSKVLLTSCTASNHTADDTDESVGGGVRKRASFQQTSRKADAMRWRTPAFISILRRTNKGESGLPARPKATTASELTLFASSQTW